MKRWGLILIFMGSALLGGECAVDIEEAIVLAIESSEQYGISSNQVCVAESKRKEVQSALYPQVNLEAFWLKNYLYPDAPCAAFTKDYYLSVGIDVHQVITTFGRIGSAIAAAKKGEKISCHQKDDMVMQIRHATRLMYYSAVFSERSLQILEGSYDHVQQNEQILRDRSESGRVSKHDNVKIASDVAARIPMVNDARARKGVAMETLKSHLCVEGELKLKEGFAGHFPDLDVSCLALKLCECHPTLKALGCAVALKEDLVRGKKAEFYPTLSAFANWKHKGGGDRYLGGDNLDDWGEFGLAVRLPLYSGGERYHKVRQAKIEKNNAQLSLRKAEENLFLELDKAIIEYRQLKSTLPASREAVRLAEETFSLSQDLFRSGQISVTDLNDAELMLTNQRLKEQTTLFNLSMQLATIERLTGWWGGDDE